MNQEQKLYSQLFDIVSENQSFPDEMESSDKEQFLASVSMKPAKLRWYQWQKYAKLYAGRMMGISVVQKIIKLLPKNLFLIGKRIMEH